MIRRSAAALMVGLVAALPAAAASAQTAPPSDGPTVTVSTPAATVGQGVAVTGAHFGPVTPISVQVCGNNAQNGSTDCDVIAGQTVVSDEHGSFHGKVVVRFPPVPCPCVVWATSHSGTSTTASVPLGIVGAPYTPPPPVVTPPASPDVEIVRAELVQTSSWRGWFGLPVDARLRVTVRNPGDTVIAHPVLSLTKGHGGDPTGAVETPSLGPLAAHEERTIDVTISLGSLAHGTYTIKGTVGASSATFRVHTSVVPWGLVTMVAMFLVGSCVWLVRRRKPLVASSVEALLALVDEPAAVDDAPVDRDRDRDRDRDESELPLMATDDELVAWGASLVRDTSDPLWHASDDWLDLTEPDEVIALDAAVGADDLETVDVAFALPGFETAKSVALCGEFNDWSPTRHPLVLRNGIWTIVVPLEPDRDYRYRFLVNGVDWVNDPFTQRRVANDLGTEDCILHTRSADGAIREPLTVTTASA
jgi:hypothetical protein